MEKLVEVVKHKHFKMGAGTTYKHIGFWFPLSKKSTEMFPIYANKILLEKPDICNGKCDHCGTPIVYHHIIEDENGEQFVVGSECIKKLDDVMLTEVSLEIEENKKKEVKKEERKLLDELERKNNNGKTNKEMRKLKLNENKEWFAKQREILAQPLLAMFSQCRLTAKKGKSLWEYKDIYKLREMLTNPNKELNKFLKEGLIYQLEFKYGQGFSSDKEKLPIILKEFEVLYENFRLDLLDLDERKDFIDGNVKKAYK